MEERNREGEREKVRTRKREIGERGKWRGKERGRRTEEKTYMPAATALHPSRKMERVKMVAEVVPSPAWSFVLLATAQP